MRETTIKNPNTGWVLSLRFCAILLIGLAIITMPLHAAEIAIKSAISDEGVLTVDWWVQGADVKPAKTAELLLDADVITIPPPLLAPDASLRACYLLMSDTSLSMKGQFKTAVIPLLTDLIQKKPPQHLYALGHFDAGLVILEPFGDDTQALLQAVERLALRGRRTELFSAVLSGLRELSRCEGYRRVLLLFSDGDAEDDPIAYTIKDAVQAAQQQGVAIYTLGFNNTIKLQILRRLAEDTGAWHWPYQAAGAATLAGRLAESTDTGGQWHIPLADLPIEGRTPALRLTLTDNRQLQVPLGIELPQQQALWLAWMQQHFPAVPAQVWAPGLSATGIVVVLLSIVWLWWRHKKANQEANTTDPLISRRPLAKIRATDMVFVMDKLSISIGAVPENDLVIDDPTVSRHQATLDYQDKTFHLTDRGATNTSLVNGEPVQHCLVEYGDELQFGNWRGVFESVDEK